MQEVMCLIKKLEAENHSTNEVIEVLSSM